jgi:hypothetical protein
MPLELFRSCGNDRVRYAARPQPCGLNTLSVAAGYFTSIAGGRIGRTEKLPPQFGQRPFKRVSTQSRQKVHSKVQIIASAASGGRSLSQHSQPGFSTSICASPKLRGERLIEIGDEIGRVFEPDRQTHHIWSRACGDLLLVGQLPVRGRGWMNDKRACVANIGKMREQF